MVKYKLTIKSKEFETKEVEITSKDLDYNVSDEEIAQFWFEKLLVSLNNGEKFLLAGKTIVPIKEDLSFEISIITKEQE